MMARAVDAVPLPMLLVGLCVFAERFEDRFNQCGDDSLQQEERLRQIRERMKQKRSGLLP